MVKDSTIKKVVEEWVLDSHSDALKIILDVLYKIVVKMTNDSKEAGRYWKLINSIQDFLDEESREK